MLRFGKASMQNLRAVAQSGTGSELANLVRKYLSVREHKAVRQIHRKLLSKATLRPVPELTPAQIAFHGGLTANRAHFTLAAIDAAKAGKVTEVFIDDL